MSRLKGIINAFATIVLILALAVLGVDAVSTPHNSLFWPNDYLHLSFIALLAAAAIWATRSPEHKEKTTTQVVKGLSLAIGAALLLFFAMLVIR